VLSPLSEDTLFIAIFCISLEQHHGFFWRNLSKKIMHRVLKRSVFRVHRSHFCFHVYTSYMGFSCRSLLTYLMCRFYRCAC